MYTCRSCRCVTRTDDRPTTRRSDGSLKNFPSFSRTRTQMRGSSSCLVTARRPLSFGFRFKKVNYTSIPTAGNQLRPEVTVSCEKENSFHPVLGTRVFCTQIRSLNDYAKVSLPFSFCFRAGLYNRSRNQPRGDPTSRWNSRPKNFPLRIESSALMHRVPYAI